MEFHRSSTQGDGSWLPNRFQKCHKVKEAHHPKWWRPNFDFRCFCCFFFIFVWKISPLKMNMLNLKNHPIEIQKSIDSPSKLHDFGVQNVKISVLELRIGVGNLGYSPTDFCGIINQHHPG